MARTKRTNTRTIPATTCTALVPYQPQALAIVPRRERALAVRARVVQIETMEDLYRHVCRALLNKEWADEPSMRREIKQHCRALWSSPRDKAAAQGDPGKAARRVHRMIMEGCEDLGVL